MTPRGRWAGGHVYVFFALLMFPVTALSQSLPDTLILRAPAQTNVIQVMNPNRVNFINYIVWQDVPNNKGAVIHQPDTSGWHAPSSTVPHDSLSTPTSLGEHTGDIDRTVSFLALESGRVGVSQRLRFRFFVVNEDNLQSVIDIGKGSGYQPNTPISCIFVDQNSPTQQTFDIGLRMSFSEGLVDSNGTFVVGLEDTEGYHIWRGLDPSGKEAVAIGELSKQVAALNKPFDVDALYYNQIVPALRATGRFDFGFPVPGLGSSIDVRDILPGGVLGADQLIWFDSNVFNGFTYEYLVTSFDRGYSIASSRQGLVKVDNCFHLTQELADSFPPVTMGGRTGVIFSGNFFEVGEFVCIDENNAVFDTTNVSMFGRTTEVTPQTDLQRVYAVPNPYRAGSSQFTTPSYHNFPDNSIRFVNVPTSCRLRIYTSSGDLVWNKTHNSNSGNIVWDVRNDRGEDVSSGIYIYRLKSDDGNSVYGRLVIIR